MALFCTHSGKQDMKRVGEQFADTVIDVYGEIIDRNQGKFNELAVKLREIA